jgi:T5SS/PEP-CTERM-associated repeat protein
MDTTTKALGIACMVFVAAAPLLSAQANTNVWSNPAGGDFSDGANWNTGTAPSTPEDAANFTDGGTYTVSFTTSVTVRAVTLRDGSGDKDITFALGGATLVNDGDDFIMDKNQVNTLTLEGGTFDIAAGEARVGNSSSTTGRQTLAVSSSANLLLSGTANMRIGNLGTGAIRVESGGVFDATSRGIRLGVQGGGNGTLTVTGTGSAARGSGTFTVGEASNSIGRVEVLNGGVLERSGTGNLTPQIATAAGSEGSLVVDGTDSVARLRNVYVGGTSGDEAGGTGLLKVSDGGLVRVSLSPSDGPGTFRVYGGGTVEITGGRIEAKEGVLFNNGSVLQITLGDKNTTPFDITAGGITLEAGVALNVDPGPNHPAIGDVFTVLAYNGTLSGTFQGLDQGSKFTAGETNFEINYGSGTDDAITIKVVPAGSAAARPPRTLSSHLKFTTT